VKLTSEQLRRDAIGLFPAATVACFDPTRGDLPRRTLDENKTKRFLERLAELRVPAILIAASTGHGHLRTVDELSSWIKIAAQAKLGETLKQVLLRPEDGTKANERLVSEAADLGYEIIFIRPGRDLSPAASDADIAKNMRPILIAAARRGFAVGVYSIPDVSGLPLTPAATAMLVEGPGGDHIAAVKVTEVDYESSTLRYLQDPKLKHLKIVQGWDTHLARALRDGPQNDSQQRQRCGMTSGPMSFAVHQYLHILAAATRGQWDEVEASQSAVTALFQAMQDDPRKFADLQRAKFIMGLGHPLTGTISQEQTERVLLALEQLPRAEDRLRLAQSLDLLGESPFRERLERIAK
jgi:dihydrodipicolinate synthase/N-acetylneuraminate lyase